MDSFSVSLKPGCPERLMSAENRWTLRSFDPDKGFAGAVVVQGKNGDRCFWEFKDEASLAKLAL